MPQINGHDDITPGILYFMSTVIQYKHDPTPNQSVSLVEREAKNPVSTSVTALDMMGLSWIFQDEELMKSVRSF